MHTNHGSYGRFQVSEVAPNYPQHFNGAVYRAVDPSTCRPVALQVIWPEDCTIRPDLIAARFPNEALAARRLVHPGIAEFIDFGVFGPQGYTLFVAYEWVGGQSLQHLLAAKRPLSVAATREILVPIATALDHVHSQGVLHGSLGPGFIWVGDQGRAKLAGLGIGTAFRSMGVGYDPSVRFTAFPPECLSAPKSADSARAEQFVLAAMTYQMLAGQPLFSISLRDFKELSSFVDRWDLAPIHTINPSVPRQAWAPLSRALDKDPRQRYATCAEFAEALLYELSRIDPTE